MSTKKKPTVQDSFLIHNDKIPEALQFLKERLLSSQDEQEKALVRAMIGALEARQAGATQVTTSFRIIAGGE